MNKFVKTFVRITLLGILMVFLCMLMVIRLRYEKAQTVYEELECHIAPVTAAAEENAAALAQQETEPKAEALSSDMSFDAL